MSTPLTEIVEKDLQDMTDLEYCIWFTYEGGYFASAGAAAELAALRSETNHRFVVCTYCGWRLDYESEKREAAHESANAHALECEKDPRNIESASLRARVGELERERDAAVSDLQDAVDFVYKVYGKSNETLAAITTGHWRAVIASAKGAK